MIIKRGIRLVVLCVLCLLPLFSASARAIVVKTQKQFDAAVEQINSGKSVSIFMKNNTFVLKKRIYANESLSIRGKKSIIVNYSGVFDAKDREKEEGGFNVFRINNEINPYALFFDTTGKIIKVSESVDGTMRVNHAEGGIIAGKEMKAGTMVKIPIPKHMKHLSNREFSKSFGYFDCGWQTINFILERSDNLYLYCKTLNLCRTGNYSYDKHEKDGFVRYVIYNAEKKQNTIYYNNEYLFVPTSISSFYYLDSGNINKTTASIVARSDLSVKGVRFRGISFDINSDASTKCELIDCSFSDNLGCALRVKRTGDSSICQAIIKNCVFEQVSLLSDNAVTFTCPNAGGCYAYMTGCEVVRYPDGIVGYKNPNGAVGVEGNVTLVHNIIWNTPRCHLYFYGGNIVAKGNVLFNSEGFNSYDDRNLSSDFGLVYCNHVYKSAENAIANISNFIILDSNLLCGAYAYNGDARGVFIDNGRGDVTCKDNIILNCQLYSLDSRNSMHDAASIRNRYEGNVVTSRYRLAAGTSVSGANTPITQSNIVVGRHNNIVSNVNVEADDIRINDIDISAMCEDKKIIVSRDLYEIIRNNNAWKIVKKYVSHKRL